MESGSSECLHCSCLGLMEIPQIRYLLFDFSRPLCWAEHMSLDNETGLDPPGIRVRPVTGLVGADYFIPGYYLWAVLISNLAQIGYEEKTIYMATYDWRISFQNTQARDQTLSRLKINIELMVAENFGKRVVVVAHSMGVLYFLHFMKWVEAPVPMGGGGGPNWCARHIKAVMNIGGPFLGIPKAVAGLFSGEVKDVAAIRSIAPGSWLLDYLRLLTLRHVMRMTRSWDSTMSMIPKGGDTIWGGLDWSPEDRYDCIPKKNKSNATQISADNRTVSVGSQYSHVLYGGIISFSKDVADSFHPRRKTNSGMLVISQIHLAKYGWSTMIWVGGPSKRLLTTKSTPLDPSLSCSVLLLRR